MALSFFFGIVWVIAIKQEVNTEMSKYEKLEKLINSIPVSAVRMLALEALENGELRSLQIYLSGFAFGLQINDENELTLHPVIEILNLLKG